MIESEWRKDRRTGRILPNGDYLKSRMKNAQVSAILCAATTMRIDLQNLIGSWSGYGSLFDFHRLILLNDNSTHSFDWIGHEFNSDLAWSSFRKRKEYFFERTASLIIYFGGQLSKQLLCICHRSTRRFVIRLRSWQKAHFELNDSALHSDIAIASFASGTIGWSFLSYLKMMP